MSKNRDHDYLYINEKKYLTDPKYTTTQFENLLKEISFGKKQESLWDIGCSNGSLLNYLVKKFPNSKLYGSDVIKESLEVAKKNTHSSIEYFFDDITKEKTLSLECDVLISVGVFQIYEEIEKILNQYISRVKPEGYIFIQGPLNKYGVDVLIKYRDNRNTKTEEIDQIGWNLWSVEYLENLFEKIKEIENYEFIPIHFPKDLTVEHDHKDTLRSWTVNVDGENKFLNGLFLQDHYFIKLKIDKSR